MAQARDGTEREDRHARCARRACRGRAPRASSSPLAIAPRHRSGRWPPTLRRREMPWISQIDDQIAAGEPPRPRAPGQGCSPHARALFCYLLLLERRATKTTRGPRTSRTAVAAMAPTRPVSVGLLPLPPATSMIRRVPPRPIHGTAMCLLLRCCTVNPLDAPLPTLQASSTKPEGSSRSVSRPLSNSQAFRFRGPAGTALREEVKRSHRHHLFVLLLRLRRGRALHSTRGITGTPWRELL